MSHTQKPDMHFQRLASNRYADIVQLKEELDLLRTQVRYLRLQRDGLIQDAERYRWLRNADNQTGGMWHELQRKESADFDTAVDEAMTGKVE